MRTDPAIVMLQWERIDLTEKAVEHLPSGYAVYLVDNGSSAGVRERTRQLAKERNLRLVQNEANLGYPGGLNRGLQAAAQDGHEFAVIVQNDALLSEGALPMLMHGFDRSNVVLVGGIVEDGTHPGHAQYAGGDFSWFWRDLRRPDKGERLESLVDGEIKPTGFVGGAILAVRIPALLADGGLYERLFIYHTDTEISWRFRGRLRLVRRVVGIHEPTSTSGGTSSGVYSFFAARNAVLLGKSIGRRFTITALVRLTVKTLLEATPKTRASALRLVVEGASAAGWDASECDRRVRSMIELGGNQA